MVMLKNLGMSVFRGLLVPWVEHRGQIPASFDHRVTENGVPPSGNTRAVVYQSVACRTCTRGGQVQVA